MSVAASTPDAGPAGPPDPAEPAAPRHRFALVAGGTGLVGQLLLPRLCSAPEYGSVVVLARRPPQVSEPLLDIRPAKFDDLDRELADLAAPRAPPVDVYCCLGTTLRAAGSRAAFRRVDHDYVLALGRWAEAVRARRFIVVTAMGADPESHFFYNRVKGEVEQALRALDLPALTVLRPSLIDGRRRTVRPAERLALLFMRPVRRLLPASIRPVRAGDIAASMLRAARAEPPPALVLSAEMHGAARNRLRASPA